jgi:uncharacterized damage-inducible protein DinB
MNTGLLRNCIAGMTDEQARRRVGHRTNNMGYIVLHVVDARFHLAQLLGADITNPYGERFKTVRSLEEAKELPSLAELAAAWDDVSTAVMNALHRADEEDLAKSTSTRFPIGDESMLGAVVFLAQHESYHIGQLGFIRKELGLGRMRWVESEKAGVEKQ